ncbi:hypothetical protein BN1263170317 [Stenotrophomonas maltophilia]|nr:hypothetical protein BN1263170317 [Stenotrophomonas maltophilia]
MSLRGFRKVCRGHTEEFQLSIVQLERSCLSGCDSWSGTWCYQAEGREGALVMAPMVMLNEDLQPRLGHGLE